jgi:hypothetical protein
MDNKILFEFLGDMKALFANIPSLRSVSFSELSTLLLIIFFVFVGPILSVLNIVALALNFLRSDFRNRMYPKVKNRKVSLDTKLEGFFLFVAYYVAFIAGCTKEGGEFIIILIIFSFIFPVPIALPALAICGFFATSWALLVVEPFNFLADIFEWNMRLSGGVKSEIG